MQTRGVVELDLPLTGGLQGIARSGRRREEAEGVQVRAHQLLPLDDGICLALREPQRKILVALLARAEPVDHRPLVQPEAAELRPAAAECGRREQPRHERQGVGALAPVPLDIRPPRDHPVPGGRSRGNVPVPGAVPCGVEVGDYRSSVRIEVGRRVVGDLPPRMPAAQLRGGEGIVGEVDAYIIVTRGASPTTLRSV